jgi:protein-L-isoaspartate(D-aspartate) O-methyltransferase
MQHRLAAATFLRVWVFFFCIFLSSVTCLFPQQHDAAREDLLSTLRNQGITDEKVLAAIRKVPREVFVEKPYVSAAYRNTALPITEGQTISQPLVVALMTQALRLKGNERVLEVGTGSGYQAAVLAEIAEKVFTVEIKAGLAEKARTRLKDLGYRNVHMRVGDGYKGWPEEAPFDAIMVTASASGIPAPLIEQLAEGGRLIMPVGESRHRQDLTLLVKKDGKIHTSVLADVVFVRMTGEAESGR